jgi:class 3 adenylate cyclase
MSVDVTTLSMTEIIRLQDLLSKELKRRFEQQLALGFADIVDASLYFARRGDEAGRKLKQRHADLLQQSLLRDGSRIVDTAGEGAFLCFPTVESATDAFIAFQKRILTDNADRPHEEQLRVRIGVHWGPVLTDGVLVTGDSVNLCARVAGSAHAGEIRLTGDAFYELNDNIKRIMCAPMPAVEFKGIPRPIDVVRLDWVDRQAFPDRVTIQETGEAIDLPQLDTISFGRMREGEGVRGNDVVLELPDKQRSKQISRWHFELRRRPDGMVLRQVSDNLTEVNGQRVERGSEVPVRKGTVARVGKVMNLVFEATSRDMGRTADVTSCPT